MLRRRILLAVVFVVLFGLGWWVGRGSASGDLYANLDLFVEVLQKVRENYVEPVESKQLVDGATRGMMATLDPFYDFQDAVRLANDSRYGLQAGVFTNNLSHAMYAFQELEVGGVIINDVPSFRVDNMPYGGVKESGFGREGVRWSMEEMTEVRLMVLRNARP